jgi:hypothetical protein
MIRHSNLIAIVLVLAGLIGILVPRWMRLLFATGILVIQLLVLGIELDITARRVLDKRITANALTPDFEDGVRSMRDALMPHRLILIAGGCGLWILVLREIRKN